MQGYDKREWLAISQKPQLQRCKLEIQEIQSGGANGGNQKIKKRNY